MAYTSGRTVKSSRKARPTTIASATADAHRLIHRHLDMASIRDLATVTSTRTADPRTLNVQVRTVITYPSTAGRPTSEQAADALAAAAGDLPGAVRVARTAESLTITRNV